MFSTVAIAPREGTATSTEVSTNSEHSRYEIRVDGELAGFTEFRLRGASAVFPHTEIDEHFSGRGLATTLIGAALDDVRARGVTVVPVCPFVKSFIDKHPGYQDLLA